MNILTKFIARDVRGGLAAMRLEFLWFFVLASFFFLVLIARASIRFDVPLCMNFQDYLVCFVAGMPTYVFDPSDPFKIPAQWLLICLLIAYSTLHYPFHDLSGVGMQMILASGSRGLWWLSKCIWIVVGVAAFFSVGIIAAALLTVLFGGNFESNVSEQALEILGFDMANLRPSPWNALTVVFVSATVMIAICHAQMMISLLTKPLIGFISTSSILFLSAFIQSPFLAGNYLMAARSHIFVSDGLHEWQGLLLAFVISTSAIVIGYIYFQRMDLLRNEDKL